MEIGELFSGKKIRLHLIAGVILALSGCSSSPEAISAKHLAAGKALLEKKDAARAVLEFKTAAQATPKDSEVQYQLGMAYLATGDIGRGAASLHKALELNPKHPMARLRLAQLMSNTSNEVVLKEARQRLESFLQDSPNDPDALHALAFTEMKLGDPKDAMQHLEQAIRAAPQQVALAATLAETKIQQKDFKGAEEVLRKACENSPKSADCIVIEGRLYAIENRPADAAQKFEQALKMDPNDPAALLNLATLENAAGRKQEAEQNFRRLSNLPDKMFKAYHAMFLVGEGRLDEAIKEFEVLAKQDPEDRLARTRLVIAYQTAKRSADAQKVLNEALKKNPKDLDALLQRAELSLDTGKLVEAEQDLNQVLHLRPDSPEVHYALAKLHQARGVTPRQREELNQVLRLNPALVVARVELAKSMMSENPKAALGVLDGAPTAQRRLVSIVEQRNWALLGSQQLDEARKSINLGLASVHTPDFLLQDAVLKINEKHYPEARQSLHEVMAKAPEDVRALRLLVRSYAMEKQVPAAVEQVRAHVAQNPKSAAVQYFWGNLLLEIGNQAEAKQAFVAAKAINPDYTPADLSLAQVDLTQSDWKDARQELTALISRKGENPLARKWLGMLELSAGNQPAAITHFRKVIEVQPDNAIVLNDLAYLLADNGQAEEALKHAQRAQELAPDNADIEDTLGWVLYRKGVYNAAVTHFKSAISKGGGIRQQYHLAMAYFKAGDEGHGRMVLATALRKDPNVPEAKLAQQVSQENPKVRP